MTFELGSYPGSLILKIRRVGFCDTFARAFRLLFQIRLSPNLVALQSTGIAPTLLFARVTLETEESSVFKKSSGVGLAKTRGADRSDERTIQNNDIMATHIVVILVNECCCTPEMVILNDSESGHPHV